MTRPTGEALTALAHEQVAEAAHRPVVSPTDTLRIPAIIEWTREQLDSHLTGAGAETWDWYRSSVKETPTGYAVTMCDPEGYGDDDTGIYYTFTVAEAVAAIAALVDAGDMQLARGVAGDDLDADLADRVIQQAAYGKQVFA